MTRNRKTLEQRLATIEGITVSESMFGERDAYWVNGKEIAHVEAPGVMEVRLTRDEIRARRPDLKADARVDLRPNTSDWITVRFDDADTEFVVTLVTIAAGAHRPPPGVAAKPPPTGPELDHRRRFH